MQQQQPTRFRSFLLSPPGKALLLALAVLATFASLAYVYTLVAIPAILLFGLAVPIWAGLKAPRYLALTGLVIILLVAPLWNVVVTQEIMTPVGPSSSSSTLPEGNGGAVLQNAVVNPYVGGTSENFTWSVTIFPQYLPGNNSSVLWLTLYVSSCPGATGPSDPSCSQPYPFWTVNPATNVSGITTETNSTVNFLIGSVGIWDWQMSLAYHNGSRAAGNVSYVFLVGDPTYNGIEGPVVGSFATTYEALLLTLYIEDLLFLGLPFYLVLLVYMILKRRERTKADDAKRAAAPPSDSSAGPTLPSAKSGSATGSSSASAPPTPKEGACPSCGAVVYAGEKTCWKCGATLGAAPSATLLSSSNRP